MGLYNQVEAIKSRLLKRKPLFMVSKNNGVKVEPESTNEPYVWTYDRNVMCKAMGALYNSDTSVVVSTVGLIESIQEVGATIWRDCFSGSQPNYAQLRDWTLDWIQSAKETCTESEAVKNLSASLMLKQAELESLDENESKILTKRRNVVADIALRLESAEKQAVNFRRRLMKSWAVAYEFKTPLKDGGVSIPSEDSEKLKESRADTRSTTVDNTDSEFKKLNKVVRRAINGAENVAQLEFITGRWAEVDTAIKPFAQEAKWIMPED